MEHSSVEESHNSRTIRVSRSLLIFTTLVSLIMGVVGGISSVYILSGLRTGQFADSSLSLPIRQRITLDEGSKFIEVAKNVNPSVVAISTSRNVADWFGQVFQQKGGGSGFVVSADGLIVTNKHVVSESNASYQVVLSDGSTYDAQVKAIDPVFDFAVLKIDAKNLKPVEFGDSDQLQVGQWVIAIGNALAEFQNTVTTGIISAKERSITAGDSSGGKTEALEGVLQTDAAINPGNSGGPLLNMAGQVVAVNTAVASGAQGIGFAIPVNVLKPAVESVIKTGRIIRPALGVRYVSLTKTFSQANKLSVDHGAYIQAGSADAAAVLPNSPADKAGLKLNDIITAVNDQSVDETHGLSRLIQQYNVGDKIKITYFRDGKEHTTDVTLEELK